MAENTDSPLELAARYIDSLRGDESFRSLGGRAGVSHSVVADFLNRKSLPKADTLVRIGAMVGANMETLLKLSGYLPSGGRTLNSGEALALAQRLDELPEPVRTTALSAIWAQVAAFHSLAEQVQLYEEAIALEPEIAKRVQERLASRDSAGADDSTPPSQGEERSES